MANAAPCMTLQYRLAPASRGWRRSRAVRLVWTLADPVPDFAGFLLVASQQGPPLSPSDGMTVYSWIPAGPVVPGTYETYVDLDPIRQAHWQCFYCKAFLADPLQQPFTIVIHPNTCVRLTDKGRIDAIPAKNRGKTWKPGTPRTITCPVDFWKFPVEEIRYGRSGKSERIKAKYTVLDTIWGRIRGRKRRRKQVKDSDGMIYTQKYCPQGHLLPVTADRQESLTIGLIGKWCSGKTIYLGALQYRLLGRAGNDMGIGVFGVTDDTKRYEQGFMRPLIEEHRESMATMGTPPL